VNKMERSPERFETTPPARSGNGRKLLVVGVVVLLAGALTAGIWKHYSVHAQLMAAPEQQRDFVPTVATATVNASGKMMSVTWPGTTEAFAQANIYARASGYISKRDVDIGSRVKAGQLLVEITAPELDHQIAQAEATLVQMQASLQQAQANRDLGQVTWNRDSVLVQRDGLPRNRVTPIA
jgi:multidrug efflux pump subunit AcrA (membrane-fusion protein)